MTNMNNDERFILTRAGYDDLTRELAVLEAQQRTDQQEFADVNDQTDSSHEEAAYDDAEVTKGRTDDRVSQLRYVLQQAQVIDEDPDPLRANPGDRVTVWDFAAKATDQFDLVGSSEVLYGRAGVPVDSPVGQALMGHQVGDVIQVMTPDGSVRYAIRKIEPTP